MSLDALVLHEIDRRLIEEFVAHPSHALLVTAPTGSGKVTVARTIASLLLQADVIDHPYTKYISAGEGKSIGIEATRELDHFLSLKVPSNREINRVILIEDAHLMTIEAQNSILKTLEEPPTGTVLLLTVSQPEALLPTIRSRSQAITLKRPPKAALKAHFAQHHSAEAITKALTISGGLVGLTHAILSNEEHPLMPATEKARELLKATAYERMLLVDALSKDRELADNTLAILQQMAHVALQSAPAASAKKWQKILQASYETSEALRSSAQPKLALSNFVLQMQ
jgi:DNA polymerase-3 subunit delta'